MTNNKQKYESITKQYPYLTDDVLEDFAKVLDKNNMTLADIGLEEIKTDKDSEQYVVLLTNYDVLGTFVKDSLDKSDYQSFYINKIPEDVKFIFTKEEVTLIDDNYLLFLAPLESIKLINTIDYQEIINECMELIDELNMVPGDAELRFILDKSLVAAGKSPTSDEEFEEYKQIIYLSLLETLIKYQLLNSDDDIDISHVED